VILKEDKAALEEVVVTSAYGNQKKREVMQTRKVVDTLEPAEGWAYFDDYIARSLDARADQELQSVSGEVKLSFEVNRNGEPVNIRVEKSLCPRCDEEAIRLLKEGPKWKKKKNKKGKVTIRF
jgi:TonB family protein